MIPLPEDNVQPVRARLLREIQSGAYAAACRLPRESELALALGISRTQLRDSLSQLEREGFITRRHGVGTIINRQVVDVPVRMDIEMEFMEMVRASGFEPGLAWAQGRCIPGEAQVTRSLAMPQQGLVLQVARLITADGRGAILCYDYIDCGRIRNHAYTQEAFRLPIFSFLQQYCALEPVMDITQVSACNAEPAVAEALGLEPGAALLYMDEVDYDVCGQPILYSQEYYAPGVIGHTVIRKKF